MGRCMPRVSGGIAYGGNRSIYSSRKRAKPHQIHTGITIRRDHHQGAGWAASFNRAGEGEGETMTRQEKIELINTLHH
jgi:hypothetical protein